MTIFQFVEIGLEIRDVDGRDEKTVDYWTWKVMRLYPDHEVVVDHCGSKSIRFTLRPKHERG